MDKKVLKNKKNVYDDKEDLEIKNIAYFKGSSQVLLLFVLIILFGFTLFNSLYYIGRYYMQKENLNKGQETIEINDYKNNVLIINDTNLDKTFTDNDLKDPKDITLENTSSIVLTTDKKATQDGLIKFDVRFNIEENTFPVNLTSKSSSDIRVRFAYSFDNENWTYINNAISTNNSTITPLMGNYYDISGLVDNLRVETNYSMSSAPGKQTKMYWKSEVLIKNNKDIVNKKIKGNLKIEYKESE